MPEEKKQPGFFVVRGVNKEARNTLRSLSLARYGKPSASQYVRDLIYERVRQAEKPKSKPDLSTPMRRIQMSLPEACLEQITELAGEGSTPQLFITSLIYERLGTPQLDSNAVDALRQSNYQLTKIGINVNQIARAFNQLVVAYQGKDKLPPVAREMDKLKGTIKNHTDLVLSVLEQGTFITNTRGKGSGNKKRLETLAKRAEQGGSKSNGSKKKISRKRK
ncbi:MAG: plasmid mobilization relaxosome protein MobC [Halothiobacillaceae bacterium]|nr:plasmid mobilization relaxosome protein MobC [Halothiobacillaceae bacterium]